MMASHLNGLQMSNKKPLEIDMIAGSQLRDSQSEMLSVEGADISDLTSGKGRINADHGKGFYNCLGTVIAAKKIFKEEDCEDERQRYYWNKVKAPYIYVKARLFDNEDHPHALAAAAILRNIHKTDIPLKVRASVEGGVISRGIKDSTLLARTKIHSVALTFTPANQATLVEPISLDKSSYDETADMELIKSVMHLAETNVPSFRHITRDASASKILNNIEQIREIADKLGISEASLSIPSKSELIKQAVESKIVNNIKKINELVSQLNKALMAGYGGAGVPTMMTGGNVIQSESMEGGRRFKYISCDHCGKEQIYHPYQVKCRELGCGQSFSLEKLYKLLTPSK